jgi:hypothetical protein
MAGPVEQAEVVDASIQTLKIADMAPFDHGVVPFVWTLIVFLDVRNTVFDRKTSPHPV